MGRIIKFRSWDGDTTLGYKENGYQMRKVAWHPHSNKRGYYQEHRLVIERKIGRFLIPRKELVHHINGKRDDNREENLHLSNPKDHAVGHLGERNSNGRFVCVSHEFDMIKFRLHDTDRNLTQIYTLSELISKTYRRGKFEFRGRFTGLKDKNCKEIYEGDIIRWSFAAPNDDVYYTEDVKWDECGFFLDGGAPLTVAEDDCEVIGNIYETPDLLK